MTALQELATVKSELERFKAESGLNAQTATEASTALSAVTAERDSLLDANAKLLAELDVATKKVAALENAGVNFAAAVDAAAAKKAVEQLAAVGAEPVKAQDSRNVNADNLATLAADIRMERDPAKRAAKFAQLQSVWAKTQ